MDIELVLINIRQMSDDHLITFLYLLYLLSLVSVLWFIVGHGHLAIRSPIYLLPVVTGLDITNLLSPVVTKNFRPCFHKAKRVHTKQNEKQNTTKADKRTNAAALNQTICRLAKLLLKEVGQEGLHQAPPRLTPTWTSNSTRSKLPRSLTGKTGNLLSSN